MEACSRLLSRGAGAVRTGVRRGSYKAVRRPDPASMKMPAAGRAGPSVLEIIREKVRLSGPLPLADFMHLATTNPTEGYYFKKELIGADGDFITSPEISQLFGEMLAVWFYAETQKMGAPRPLQFVELGPGRGTLLIDMLRVMNRLGYKSKELSLHLVEISPTLQSIQANRLCITHKSSDENLPYYYEGETLGGSRVFWYNDLKKVPEGFSWYVAHEFFDALPVHRFEKTKEGWRELLIDMDESGELSYRLSAGETKAARMLVRPPLDARPLAELEVSPRALGLARQLARRVDAAGGLALVADYGHEGEKGDTFRAFHKHKVVDPLKNPGSADLTADVDFSQLRIAASAVSGDKNYALVVGPVTQRDFLQRLQAPVRLQVLVENAKEEDKEALRRGYELLVAPDKMGERFKFMAFYPSSMAAVLDKYPPLGFSQPPPPPPPSLPPPPPPPSPPSPTRAH